MDKVRYTMDMPVELRQRLEEEAKRRDRQLAWLIRLALEEWLDDLDANGNAARG